MDEQHAESRRLQDLLEGTVDGRAGLLALVEVDGGDGTLADALRSELKFLFTVSNCKKKKKKSWNARNVQLTL